MGETDFEEVFFNIWKLLASDKKRFGFDDGKPFVFTHPDDCTSEENSILMMKSFITQISKKDSPIDIYPMSRLFYILATNLTEIDRYQNIENISIARLLLSRDPYEHRSGFSCDYHEKIDACAHCALSKATRCAYLMAKHLCEPLGINLVSGKHLPMDPDVKNLHRSFQSLYESDAEVSSACQSNRFHDKFPKIFYSFKKDLTCDYETQSDHSFDDGVSISARSCVSNESRQIRLQKLLGLPQNRAVSHLQVHSNNHHYIEKYWF